MICEESDRWIVRPRQVYRRATSRGSAMSWVSREAEASPGSSSGTRFVPLPASRPPTSGALEGGGGAPTPLIHDGLPRVSC